ncbi:LOW QUALITY PROTEIN: AAA-ATPase At5g57480 [Eucalyptus grandis]|uniref:LOW QUALITY PROTEIN: AAA-ATPase At5g57480 n=1 Tax=Eucalyptus grandis TaxID=71139 RepID=UPI000525BBAC|nr:LOW QUALITY PROTEIN: AAA-ATPase At5g57480 [Eucalyptus grandis]
MAERKESWTSLASLLGTLAFCQTFLQTFLQVVLPPELRHASLKFLTRALRCFSSYCYFDVAEMDGVNTNELYNAVHLYLSSFASTSASASRLSLTRARNSSVTTFGLSSNDSIADVFNGVAVQWEHAVTQRQSQPSSWRSVPDEKRGFTLRIKKRDKDLILNSYLDHIMDKANDIRRNNQERLIYTNSRGSESRGRPWEAVPFKHPSTFDTLAMDPEKKRDIMEDLRDFAAGQAFYQRTGRAWKRGYLLYGPPGTGKSSMIAAMANFLGYDIYDLELTEVPSNTELRKLLMKTSSKSIIVIEDIDCSVNLSNRSKAPKAPPPQSYSAPDASNAASGGKDWNNNTMTLSGLLNFTDGLWSCCGSERIFVFTTNHIDKLDPALLRSGRMDMHICMSYCSYPALEILLHNYLGSEGEDLSEAAASELREAVEKAKMTPADISEVLIKKRRNREKVVSELLEVMKARAEGNEEYGGLREKFESNGDEEEEQEKRALESPKEVSDRENDSCQKVEDQVEKKAN